MRSNSPDAKPYARPNTKKSPVRPSKPGGNKPDPRGPSQPPNDQMDKDADEIYGDTEIPSRKK